jgi:hypothetical protein
MGVDPNSDIRNKNRSTRERYNRLWQLIESCRDAGTLRSKHPFSQDIEPAKFIEWAKSQGEDPPKGWRPCPHPKMLIPQQESADSVWTTEEAIAEDLFDRIHESDKARKDGNYGPERIYKFLMNECPGVFQLSEKYKLGLYSYELKDDKADDPDREIMVGKKSGWIHIRIEYSKPGDNNTTEIPFRQFTDVFRNIKNQREEKLTAR